METTEGIAVENELDQVIGALPGIDERERTEALLIGETRLLEMVALGRPMAVVLDAVCRLFDSAAIGGFSSVTLFDRRRAKVEHVAGPGLPYPYKASLEGQLVTEEDGPCGTAMQLNTPVIVSDIDADRRWERGSWPAMMAAHGLKSCWCSPIRSLSGELLGTFAVYHYDAATPTPFHDALSRQFIRTAAVAIEGARREEALKRSEAFLAQAQHLSSTGSFSWRVATDEITWSAETYRLFELDPALPVTLDRVRARVHPDDLPAFAEQVARCREGEDSDFEFRARMPDGSIKHLRAVALGTLDEAGHLEYTGTIQDVTQRRLSEDTLGTLRSELSRVARAASLSTLTAAIAHEVNQPLAGIITNASTCLRMLADEPPNLEGARETARRAIRDGHRASDVIKRLRALFAKKDTATELIDLNEATREILALASSELRRGRVTLRALLADDLPLIRGDRIQLQQVILNLLLNASDAMSGMGDRLRPLLVTTARDGDDRVRLSVQDAGTGFAPESLDRLFEPFYTTKPDGMGIGLSLSRCVIDNQGGRLWATANDGPGSTFSFSLPRATE